MNRNRIDKSQADSTAIESILATEEELVPSSGFLASVMERVHEEAAAHSRPFRFRGSAPCPALCSQLASSDGPHSSSVRLGVPAARSITFTAPQISAVIERPLEQAGWVAMALAVSLVSWLLSRRIAGQSGL